MPNRPGSSSLPNKVRIIGGLWKRTVLPVADLPGLRPTPDRVRETLFNWLVHGLEQFEGRTVLDAFAGTGALGLEAASRGAAQVVLVEQHPGLVKNLHASVDKLKATQVRIVRADAMAVLARYKAHFDLIFLDPPFAEGWIERVWPSVAAAVKPDGWVYVESEAAFEPPEGWSVVRALRAGQVHAHLLRRQPAGD